MSHNELIYSQSTGRLTVKEGEKTALLGKGYSGQPPYVNQGAADGLRAAGPLPCGRYRIGPAFDHVRLGPAVHFLEPLEGNDMKGRSGFFIHGDNRLGNQTASHGCIILSRAVRLKVASHRPATLVVVR